MVCVVMRGILAAPDLSANQISHISLTILKSQQLQLVKYYV